MNITYHLTNGQQQYLHLFFREIFKGRGHFVDIGSLRVENKRILEREIHVSQELYLVGYSLPDTH